MSRLQFIRTNQKHNLVFDKVKLSNSQLPAVPTQVESMFPREKWSGVRTLVAVSGGPDSVGLLRALVELERREGGIRVTDLVVAHVNHGIRGTESDRDEKFVRRLATELGVECHVAGPNGRAAAIGDSEEGLRDFRYEQLVGIATEVGARYLLMGHHLDDQVETILFRIFRGTGISGLAGIPPIRRVNDSLTIVRPLFESTRIEIEKYLESIGQSFCVDRSNSDTNYSRNFIRNDLMPRITERFGESASTAIARLAEQARDVDRLIMSEMVRLDETLVSRSCDHLEIDCVQLSKFDSVLIRRWLAEKWAEQAWPRQAMTYQWWKTMEEQIRETRSKDRLEERSGNVVLNLPGNIRFEKQGKLLRLFVVPPVV